MQDEEEGVQPHLPAGAAPRVDPFVLGHEEGGEGGGADVDGEAAREPGGRARASR